MTLLPSSAIREVNGITNDQKQRIRDFLQGAAYSWCKNRKDEWFSLRDLMGGDNYFWENTPLFVLYEKQINLGHTNNAAVEAAGKDGGWIFKKLLSDDSRIFETKKEDLIRKYLWVGGI